jgi:hypothetical protein
MRAVIVTVFSAVVLLLSTILPIGFSTYATPTVNSAIDDPGVYMTGQRIATYEEMGIQSLLQKYKNNTLDPEDLINDIYDRIELNDANEQNPILISRVSRDDVLERVDELKELRASLSPGIDFTNEYPLWGIPFVV